VTSALSTAGSSAVVQRFSLKKGAAFDSAKQFRLDDVNVALVIRSQHVYLAATCVEFPSDDQELQVLANICKRQALRVVGDVLLKKALLRNT
jgi:hypothetical protein